MNIRRYHMTLLLLSTLCGSHATGWAAAPIASALRCEQLINPLGIDARLPRLSWEIIGEERGLRQVAYQVLVATSLENLAKDKGDGWNSGKVVGDQSQGVPYAGL